MVRALLIILTLLCAPLAWAAPVQLPGGEAVADWSAAFAMAGILQIPTTVSTTLETSPLTADVPLP